MSNKLYHLLKVRHDLQAAFEHRNQLKDQMDLNTIDGLISGLKSYHGFNPVGILAEDDEYVIVLAEYDDRLDDDGGPYAFALMHKDTDEPVDIFSGYATPEQAFRASEDEYRNVYESTAGAVYGALAYRHIK